MWHILKPFIVITVGLVLLAGQIGAQDENTSALPCPIEAPDIDIHNIEQSPFFVTDAGVFLDRGDDELLLLTDASPVSRAILSDDGERVAYIRNIWEDGADRARLEIWVMNADGSDDRLLVDTETLTSLREEPFDFTAGIVSLDWIPGTHTLALNTGATPLGDGIHNSIADDLWTIDADTGELTSILPQGAGGAFHYAPDGAHVAILTPGEMWIMNADGSAQNPVDIAEYAAIGMGTYVYPPVVWLDSKTLLVAVSAGDPYSSSNSEVTVWRVSLDGTAESISTFPAFFASFTISPDGQWAAYWRTDTPQSNVRDLHVAAVDGSYDIAFLTNDTAEFAAWVVDEPGFFVYRETFQAQPDLGHVCGAAYETANG